MTTFNFYGKHELKEAKKERRNPLPVFGITSSPKAIGHYIKRLELEGIYIWREEYAS